MIDREAFKGGWKYLLTRFNKEWDQAQAKAYYDYLSELMDTEDFLVSCRAVWATAKWFPRPADFLTVRAGSEWPLVLKAAEEYRPPDASWFETWKQLSPRAQAAVKRLGGIDHVRDQLGRSSLKLREAFLAAYEEEATAEALALPAPVHARQLPAA